MRMDVGHTEVKFAADSEGKGWDYELRNTCGL